MERPKIRRPNFLQGFKARGPRNFILEGPNFLAQRMNFHRTGRKNLSGVGTLEDAGAGAG
jgi:hypothetical protein